MCCVRFLQMVCDYYHREVNDRRFLISITRPNENICTRCIVMATALCVGQKLKSQAAGERVMFCVRLNYRVHVWQISQTGSGFWKKKKIEKNREREREQKNKMLIISSFYSWLTSASKDSWCLCAGTTTLRTWTVTSWEPCGSSPSLSCPSATETWFLTPTVAKESVYSLGSWSVHHHPPTPPHPPPPP